MHMYEPEVKTNFDLAAFIVLHISRVPEEFLNVSWQNPRGLLALTLDSTSLIQLMQSQGNIHAPPGNKEGIPLASPNYKKA